MFQKLNGHRSAVLSLAMSPDQQFLASGSRDGSIRIWNDSGICIMAAFTSTPVYFIKYYTTDILYFSSDNRIFSLMLNKNDLINKSKPFLLMTSLDDINQFDFEKNTNQISIADDSGIIQTFKDSIKTLNQKHSNLATAVKYKPNAQHEIWSCGMDFKLYAFNTITKEIIKEVTFSTTSINPPFCCSLAFSSDGKWIAVGRGDSIVTLIDLRKYKKSKKYDLEGGHSWSVTCIEFIKIDQKLFIVSGGICGRVAIWDIDSKKMIGSIESNRKIDSLCTKASENSLLVYICGHEIIEKGNNEGVIDILSFQV